MKINNLAEYLDTIKDPNNRIKFAATLEWVTNNFPDLQLEIRYNAPMLVKNNSYIVGFSAYKNHYSIGLEGQEVTKLFITKAEQLNFKCLHKTIQIPYSASLPDEFFTEIIKFKIEQKKDCKTFWLPANERFNPQNNN
ncbi:hypothetical protein R4B61_03390 [Fructilactobacillus vespulae]|uniref:iron chaperone n=1 Tax=Fructilactobacillus vespulae TaxID=1249630 RepID=UPI0039B5224E